jgi:two-component system heavy metal sensor histidine kinase CusS
MPIRSLRAKLSILYVAFTLISMTCLGMFSYWLLARTLESSRRGTMRRREERIINYVNTWPSRDGSLTLNEKLLQLSKAIAETDTIQIYDLNGKLLYSSPGADNYKRGWTNSPCIDPCNAMVVKNGHMIRTLEHVVTLDGRKVHLSISGITDEHIEVLQTIRNSYLICCPLLLIVSVIGGLALSHRALAPVSSITNKARTIGIQDLKHRLPVPQTGDEIQLLAETWNGLLERLDNAVDRLTQFTGDLSHDLRTTITVMLTNAEFALRRQRSEAEYRAALTIIVSECNQTSCLLDDLLAASRADIVQQNISWNAVELCSLVTEVCEGMCAKLDAKRQSLMQSLCQDAWTMGDLSMLRRLITILLDNAIKYTTENGAITISVERSGNRIRLDVVDTGVGIAPEARDRIFDRFYRGDISRNRDDGSMGLGLAIAKWIVEAHAATIHVTSEVGRGSSFVVSFAEMQMPLRTGELDSITELLCKPSTIFPSNEPEHIS